MTHCSQFTFTRIHPDAQLSVTAAGPTARLYTLSPAQAFPIIVVLQSSLCPSSSQSAPVLPLRDQTRVKVSPQTDEEMETEEEKWVKCREHFSHFLLPDTACPFQPLARLWISLPLWCTAAFFVRPPLAHHTSPDLNLYGHSGATRFYPSCSNPHIEQPLLLVEEVDTFDMLLEEPSPLWWWLVVPGVTPCPSGIHHCRLSGDERIFLFSFFFMVFGVSVPRVTTTHASLLVPFIHQCTEACIGTEGFSFSTVL